MDLLGIKWLYEPEFYTVGLGFKEYNYKPDFFLPELKKYLEIKPNEPSQIEAEKALAWIKEIGPVVILFEFGIPTESSSSGWSFFTDGYEIPILMKHYWWCECPKCHAIDITCVGEPECGCYSRQELNAISDDIKPAMEFEKRPVLFEAFKMARQFKLPSVKNATALQRQASLLSL